jgi:hypothetical protein
MQEEGFNRESSSALAELLTKPHEPEDISDLLNQMIMMSRWVQVIRTQAAEESQHQAFRTVIMRLGLKRTEVSGLEKMVIKPEITLTDILDYMQANYAGFNRFEGLKRLSVLKRALEDILPPGSSLSTGAVPGDASEHESTGSST